jgi:polyisoprenoid-binding protein YceI
MKPSLKSAVAALMLTVPSLALGAEYDIDSSHTSAQFSVKHMMVTNVRGELGKVVGTIHYDEKDVSKSSVDVVIDATAINTREPKRDEHLRSPDFFDVEKFPSLTFKSTKVQKDGKGLKVTGDLTIRGVTKPVVLAVEGLTPELKDPWGNVKRGTMATTRINRKDFGLNWNKTLETGGVLVGDDVAITIDVQLSKKQASDAEAKK